MGKYSLFLFLVTHLTYNSVMIVTAKVLLLGWQLVTPNTSSL